MNYGELRLPGIIDSIGQLIDFVRATASQAGLSTKARHGLLLAADEIATNIVRHGYEEAGAEGEIELSAEEEGEFLILTLVDTGQPFDPREAQQPAGLDQPLEKRQIGGLGIYLALQQLDKFQYERRDGRNVSRLMIRLGT